MKRPSTSVFVPPKNTESVPLPFVQAGQLVSTNAGWRTSRPVVNHEECVLCRRCYLVCPDGAVYVQDERITLDYDFCKGCGVCANECPKKALAMQPEEN